jgi:hypothetical protein
MRVRAECSFPSAHRQVARSDDRWQEPARDRSSSSRVRRRIASCFLLQLTAAIAATSAAANDAPGLELEWQAPAECPSKQDVEQLIEQQRSAKPGPPATITARIRIADRSASASPLERYVLNLDLRVNSIASHRSLNAESCAAAADAAVLMIGLALDSQIVESPAAADATTAVEQLRPPRFELAASPALLFATLPGQGWGAMLQFGVAWQSLRFTGSVAYYFPNTVEREGVKANIDLLSVGLAACYLYVRDPIALGVCGHAEIGRLSGVGEGIEQASPGSARIQTFGVSWQVRARLISRIWLFADARIGWNERRPRFTVEGLGQLHAPDEVALRFLLGPLIELE